MGWRAAAATMDVATALFATLNAAYFLARLLAAGEETAARRWALGVLSLVSLGALLESAFLLASLSQETSRDPLAWLLARAVLFAGTACMSALILRRGAGQ